MGVQQRKWRRNMPRWIATLSASALLVTAGTALSQNAGPNDAQIAHIAYTAGAIDIAAGRQALAKSHNAVVRGFAEEMVRDHAAVNDKALALVKRLGVAPEANATSTALSADAQKKHDELDRLNGAAFDRAYIANEIAFHRTVNDALRGTLIPSARNGELKSLLQTGLTLFSEHQAHAENLAADVK
jgi:putative membrane protein